jgi:hypothetical protein
MRVAFDEDEVWALLSTITHHVLDEADLSDEDRGRLRRWRSEDLRPGREGLRVLTEKLNADLDRALRVKERSQIQKHDWV